MDARRSADSTPGDERRVRGAPKSARSKRAGNARVSRRPPSEADVRKARSIDKWNSSPSPHTRIADAVLRDPWLSACVGGDRELLHRHRNLSASSHYDASY